MEALPSCFHRISDNDAFTTVINLPWAARAGQAGSRPCCSELAKDFLCRVRGNIFGIGCFFNLLVGKDTAYEPILSCR
jgi:hypothetical protein